MISRYILSGLGVKTILLSNRIEIYYVQLFLKSNCVLTSIVNLTEGLPRLHLRLLWLWKRHSSIQSVEVYLSSTPSIVLYTGILRGEKKQFD